MFDLIERIGAKRAEVFLDGAFNVDDLKSVDAILPEFENCAADFVEEVDFRVHQHNLNEMGAPYNIWCVTPSSRRASRYGHRDATMIRIAYRHGLRVSELVSLRWDQVDLAHGRLHVNRAKNGLASVHPLGREEIRALRGVKRENGESRYIFVTERDGPMTTAGFRCGL